MDKISTGGIVLTENLNEILRTVAEALRIPDLILLVAAMAAAVVLLGSLAAEVFTSRRHLRAVLPKLVDRVHDTEQPMEQILSESGLLRRQKALLLELTRHPQLTPVMREAMARELLQVEQARSERILQMSDLICRIGPMLGLLGTLIPLGPGLIALGQGDTYTLSQSLLTAFDTTIAGLSAAAVCFVVSAARRRWYGGDLSMLEALAECVLEREAVCHAQHHPKSAKLDCGHYGSNQGSLCRNGSASKEHFARSGSSAS